MSRLNIPIGSYFGIPVTIHWTLTLMFILGGLFGGTQYMATVFIVFLSVLLHEFGHSVMAQKLSYRVPKIVLYFCGGAAYIQLDPRKAKHEFLVTVAGPAVSLGLFLVFLPFVAFHEFCKIACVINLILLVFNLIPAWPMDGGRILRSSLVLITKNYTWSNTVAMNVALICGVLMIVGGLMMGQLMIAFIGGFVLITSHAEKKVGKSKVLQDQYYKDDFDYYYNNHD